MPPVAAAVVAVVLGLLLGFGGAAVACAALAAMLGAAAALRRQAWWGAWAACLAAGGLAAAGRVEHDRRCRDHALRAAQWRVVLEDDAKPGAYVRGTAAGSDCDLTIALAVAYGRAAAGDEVRVRGSVAAARRGAVIREAIVFETGARDHLVRLRARVSATIGILFGADAPVVRALLIADTRGLDPALRDRFAAAGLVHVLSISGLHVAIIAAATELLLAALRAPRAAASAGAIALTAGYVALIGAPAPAVRAGAMLAVGSACRLRGRPTSPWAALAVGAAAPILFDVRLVLDLGYQLSVAGIAALIASGALARRWVSPNLYGWRAAVASTVLSSTIATAVSAPLVAWHFGRVSLAAPLTNVVAGPLVAVIQPALFLAVLLSPAPPVARLAADAAHPLLVALDRVASAGASLPFASLTVTPTLVGAVLAGVACGALIVACVSYFPGRPLALAAAALALAAWLPLAPAGHGVELHMIDVGQGDAIALRTPRGRWVLFDAGRGWPGGDDGRRVVVPYLRRRGGDVAAFVLSHPHADHLGGAMTVLRALRPAAFWDGAYVGASALYRGTLEATERAGVPWRRVHPDDSVSVDGVWVRFLAPDSAWIAGLADANEASVIALVRYGAVRFLLVGDAERGEEDWLLANSARALRADVLKVGHHGSATSSSPEFLAVVKPRVALVSVGEGNSYGHPSADVMRLLAASGAAVLRTDRVGTVVVRTDGRTIGVEAMGDRWDLPP